MTRNRGKVFLVGAGPGDPGLLTIRARDLLESADVVAIDALVSDQIRALIPATTRVIEVGKRAGAHKMQQEEINSVLVREAENGARVVRLKGGDPFVFGRGGEEAEACREAGVPFEVVPGITSAIAGPAYAGIPVTHRTAATSVTFVTGKESDESTGVDWPSLARIGGTVVFLMGLGRAGEIRSRLLDEGLDPDTPAAVIAEATTPRQKVVDATLGTLVEAIERERPSTPALIVVGKVAGLRSSLAWFESRPLFGRTVVVTRARTQASALVSLLAEAGANVLEQPVIRIDPPENRDSLQSVVGDPGRFDTIVFTSVNGVEAFFEALHGAGRDARSLAGRSIAAVGSSTREALVAHGIVPDTMPREFRSEALLPLFPDDLHGRSIAVVRAEKGRDELLRGLAERGAEVTLAVAYRTVPDESSTAELRSSIASGSIDYVTFTSRSTVENFLSLLTSTERDTLFRTARAISIGPITSAAVRDAGLDVSVEADEASVASLADALIRHATSRS